MSRADEHFAPRARPTSAEVARLAQVSRTTVSFVLNGVTDRGISEATRQRVLDVARSLGYEPNAAARALAGGASGSIALVLPSVQHLQVDAFLAQLLASVSACCQSAGLKLLIETSEGRAPDDFVRLVRSQRIDGLIVAHLRTAELDHLQQLRNSGVPLVVLGGGLPAEAGFATVGDDGWQPARLAVRHLLALGHRRIGFVNYAPTRFHQAAQREQGWRQALLEAGIAPADDWRVHADISAESGWQATQTLLARGLGLTALFAGNDTIAFGALRALREAGLRVPQDMALMGYDDIPLAAFADPPLSTVRSDPAAQGRHAMAQLLQALGRVGHEPLPALPTPQLVLRDSCGASAQRRA